MGDPPSKGPPQLRKGSRPMKKRRTKNRQIDRPDVVETPEPEPEELFFSTKVNVWGLSDQPPVFHIRGLIKADNIRHAVGLAKSRCTTFVHPWNEPEVSYTYRDMFAGIIQNRTPDPNMIDSRPAGQPGASLPAGVANFASIRYVLGSDLITVEIADLRYDPEGAIDRRQWDNWTRPDDEDEGPWDEDEDGNTYELQY